MDFIETAGVNGRRLPKHRCNNRAPSSSPDTSLQTNLTSRIAAEIRSDLPQYNWVQGLSFRVGYPVPIPLVNPAASAERSGTAPGDERVTEPVDSIG